MPGHDLRCDARRVVGDPARVREVELAEPVGGDEREERRADRDEHVRPQAGLALADLPLGADRSAEGTGEDDA